MFITEFTKLEQMQVLEFFKENKALILNDILRGRGQFSADWVLVAQKVKENARWALQPMNKVINHYDGEVKISPQGSINIGKVGVQRKGGDGGRPTAAMLQFKIDPTELFNIK